MSKYTFKDQAFQIDFFDQAKTFSSFLPGLAGKRGIPMWAFYVNRGQGISSFGLRDKNGAILEFYPANLAYMYVQTIGFRTFIKINGKVIEFFDGSYSSNKVMKITQSALILEETLEEYQISIKVTYFGLPNEDIAALTRRVEIRNLSDDNYYSIEVLDGIAQILPSGIDYGGYKAISNLLRSWMNVEELDNHFAFYKLRSSTGDEAETKTVKDGNFYVSFVNHVLTTPITDLDLVFDYDTSLKIPRYFESHDLLSIIKEKQITENKVPCGFTPVITDLKSKDMVSIDTLIGFTKSVDVIHDKLNDLRSPLYFNNKEAEAKSEIDLLLHEVTTKTAIPMFDEYIRQNYLDNLLRGGYPFTVQTKDKNFVYYLYSRKHGDLERDYNFFSIAPEFYSQGNGNFRDVCQNRRSDVLLHPEINDYNFHVFASLIQADGYNPLSINGSTFELVDSTKAKTLVKTIYNEENSELIQHLQSKFTPGSIINLAYNLGVCTMLSDMEVLELILSNAKQNIEASFGEGYWADHWTYILDLIENYEHIFPDKIENALYNESKYAYFLSGVTVYPRSEKTVIDSSGVVRQYGALRHPDKELVSRFGINPNETNWLTDANKNIIYTNLYSKLFVLAVNKFALLDPFGLGIEMEGNKPGWNDAMNGLPGLFGSGMSETLELKRLTDFLIKSLKNGRKLHFLSDFCEFYQSLMKVNESDSFTYWDKVSSLREIYREKLRTPTNLFCSVSTDDLTEFLLKMDAKLEKSINQAIDLGHGIIPTYFIYEATSFDPVLDEDGQPVISHYGLPKVVVNQFELKVLPYFLEAPARLLKVRKDTQKNLEMIHAVKKTDLFDEELGMYKTSSNLDDWGYEIGRIRAFTKGWLERESNFLHMTYKYLLGILKSGNYEAFFEESKKNMVYLLDPEKYGRSTLENSSFIATSNNPNPHIFSQGFVSRLSGSTAEMLSIWAYLVYGNELYSFNNGSLQLKLSPKLSKAYFDHLKIETIFQGAKVIYIADSLNDGWKLSPYQYRLILKNDKIVEIKGSHISGDFAQLVRNQEVKEIEISLH